MNDSAAVTLPRNSRQARRARRRRQGHVQQAVLGSAMLAPTILGLLIFSLAPIVYSLGLSLFRWDGLSRASYVGLNNYRDVLGSQDVQLSFERTAIFVLLAVVLQVVIGFMLAVGMQRPMPRALQYFLRSAYFLPVMTSGAIISIVMSYIFQTDFGILNYYLGLVGIPHIPWLTNPNWAIVAIVLTYVWHTVGFTFLLFVGALATVPREIQEAAALDGASGWRRTRHILLPLVSPTILLATVIGVIAAVQVFDEPFVLTNGGPGAATRTVVLLMYQMGFRNLQFGAASALAVLLFVVLSVLTAVQFRLSRQWVFYK